MLKFVEGEDLENVNNKYYGIVYEKNKVYYKML